jgi:hypothetical protein
MSEQTKDEQAKDEQAKEEQAKDEPAKDEQAKDELASEKESVVGWNAAAEFARRSVPWLRRHHAKGELRSERSAGGEHVFARSDLEALRPEPAPDPEPEQAVPASEGSASAPPIMPVDNDGISGETYSLIFADLEAGKQFAAIIVERKLLPETVEKIIAKWRRAKATDLNNPSVPAEIELLKRRLEPLAAQNERLQEIITDAKNTVKAWDKYFKSFLTILHRIPFFWPKGVSCPSCGRNSWLPRQVMCLSCGADHFLEVSDPGPDGKRLVKAAYFEKREPEDIICRDDPANHSGT